LVLTEGTDYTITYKNNSKITMNKTSKASCTITFKGDYKGSVTKEFRIKAFDISKAVAAPISNKTYSGKEIKPAVTVKIGDTVIDAEEYEVSYTNNVKPGIATITIKGLNNFYGTLKVNFKIVPAAVTGVSVTGYSTNSVAMKWSAVAGVTGYEVYRYDTANKKYVKVGTTTGTTYSVKSLAAGTGYTLAVKAYYKTSGGEYLYGELGTVATSTKPAKVTGIKLASRTDTKIKLTWTKVNGAMGYKVYRYDTAKKKYVAVKTVGSATNSLLVSGLKGSTTYKFKVLAYRKLGSTYLWSEDSVVSFSTTPSAVKSLTVVARSTTTITLKWSKVANADGYMVYRYSKGKYVRIKTIANKTTVKFVSSKLTAGTTYKYKVTAYRKVGSSKVENTGKLISSITLPTTPLVTTKVASKKVTLSWRKCSGASGYVVYMSQSKKGTYKKLATVASGSKTAYTKTGLKKGTYYFKVRSYKKYNGKIYYSAYSTVRKVVVK
jgi:fibronectin type 3 domain-containing protein